MLLKPAALVLRGDANLDGQLDVSDTVVVLAFLFKGDPSPICPGAADFNLDHQLDISDPIGMLETLFLGAERPGAYEPAKVSCE